LLYAESYPTILTYEKSGNRVSPVAPKTFGNFYVALPMLRLRICSATLLHYPWARDYWKRLCHARGHGGHSRPVHPKFCAQKMYFKHI